MLDSIQHFLSEIYLELSETGISLKDFRLDHVGYQVASSAEYDSRVDAIKNVAKMVSENIVGGRRVGIFTLNEPVNSQDELLDVIEIFEPRPGQEVISGWEHIELTSNKALEELVEVYSDINWDTSVMYRDEFPMLILKLQSGLRVKFPRRGVLEEQALLK